MDKEEYKESNKIERLFGNMKTKMSGYISTYREGMAMVLALVKFLAHNIYMAYLCYFFVTFYIVSSHIF